MDVVMKLQTLTMKLQKKGFSAVKKWAAKNLAISENSVVFHGSTVIFVHCSRTFFVKRTTLYYLFNFKHSKTSHHFTQNDAKNHRLKTIFRQNVSIFFLSITRQAFDRDLTWC